MKKGEFASIIVYMLIIAVAVVFSLTVLTTHFKESNFTSSWTYILFCLGAIITGVVSFAILLEVGHVLGAKAGNYNILSIAIFRFHIYKEDNKWKIGFKKYDGLTGETKILPKDKKSNPSAYLLLGSLLTALLAIGFFIIFYTNNVKGNTPKQLDKAYFFLTAALTIFICLIYNILPITFDVNTDGQGLKMVSNPKNKIAFNEMLRVQHEIDNGNKNVEIDTFTEITNFTAELNMSKVYILLNQKKYDEADKILDLVLNNKDSVSYKVYLRSLAMKIYNKIVTSSLEDTKEYIDKNVDINLRKDFSYDASLMCIRTYVLIEGLVDNSKYECLYVLKNLNKAYKAVPKNRRDSEAEMFNTAINMVHKIHPKWELNNYLIEQKTE